MERDGSVSWFVCGVCLNYPMVTENMREQLLDGQHFFLWSQQFSLLNRLAEYTTARESERAVNVRLGRSRRVKQAAT